MNDQSKPIGEQPFGERREVTALCYDLVNSSRLLADFDLEDFQDLVSSFQEQVGKVIKENGGSIRDSLGDDGGMAFFGFPPPLEDSANPAIRAGLQIVEACSRLTIGERTPHVRVGIATSEVVVHDIGGGPGPTIVGYAPAIATRLQASAAPDSVLVSERTRALAGRYFAFRDAGRRTLKGVDTDQAVWEVQWRSTPATRFLGQGKLGTRMVGRKAERDRALAAWTRACAGDGQAIIVEGEAGIGKSRLVIEILKATRRARTRLLLLQCSPHAVDSALSPLADLLRSHSGPPGSNKRLTTQNVATSLVRAGIADSSVVTEIAFAVGAAGEQAASVEDPGRHRDRLLSALLRCIDLWIETGPMIIVIEDIHWIDPTSADLLSKIAINIDKRAVLLVLTSRISYELVHFGPNVNNIQLQPLRLLETASLIDELWARHDVSTLPDHAVSMLYKKSGGVPLYLEELAQWLEDNFNPSEDWSTLLSSARVSRFESILSARIGALGTGKRIAQAAAVLGREFEEDTLRAILPKLSGHTISAALRDLVKASVLAPRKRYQGSSWNFRHALIQETLYKSLVRADRAAIHRQILHASADGSRMTLSRATLGAHAEAAGLYLQAATEYVAAAKENFVRSATAEARNLLRRAQAMLGHVPRGDDRDRAELAVSAALGPVLISTGGNRSAHASQLYDEAVELARRRPLDEQAALFPIYWGWWYTGADFKSQRQRADVVMTALAGVQDAEVQLQARHCVWAVEFNLGSHAKCAEAVETGLALYDPKKGRESLTLYGGHDPRVCGLGQRGLSLWLQGYPVQAMAAVEEALRWAKQIAHVGSLTHAYDIAAMLHRYCENLDALHSITSKMRRLARKHELPSVAAKVLIFEGWRLAKLGNPARGRISADAGFAIQCEIGTREDFPVYSDMRAEILELCGDPLAAIDLIDAALLEATRTGHLYWAPELYRRRAALLAQIDSGGGEIKQPLESAMRMALDQGAMTLLAKACATAIRHGAWQSLSPDLRAAVEKATSMIDRTGGLSELLSALDQDSISWLGAG